MRQYLYILDGENMKTLDGENMKPQNTNPAVKRNLDYTIDRDKEFQPMPLEHVAAAPYFDSHEDVLEQAQSNYNCALDAILELTDNPIDAGAKNIDILLTYEDNGDPIIIISDDGKGMTAPILKDRYFLIRKDPNARSSNSLGKWGMGAKGALAYLGDRAQAFSKVEGMIGNIVYGQNYDGICAVDAPVAIINAANFADEYADMEGVWKAWHGYPHGTMVVVRGLRPSVANDCKNNGRAAFITEIEARIGLAYGRHFISKGINFRINGKLIEAVDVTAGGTLVRNAKGKPFEGKIILTDPNRPMSKGTVKWKLVEHQARQPDNKICIDRQGRFVQSGVTFGNTELKSQKEWDRYQIAVSLDDKCDGLFGIASNKTMKTDIRCPAYKQLMKSLKEAMDYVKANAPSSSTSAAQVATKNMKITEKELQEMVCAFDAELKAKGLKLRKPTPKFGFGGSSSSGSTKVYDPKVGSFDCSHEFVNAGVLSHNHPVDFIDSVGVGGRHQIKMKVNLNCKVNYACFTNNLGAVNGVRKARLEELLKYRVIQDEGMSAFDKLLQGPLPQAIEAAKPSLDVN
jgi:hypothetical protein